VTVLEGKVFKEVIKVKMRLLGKALIPSDWCPYKRLGHVVRDTRQVHTTDKRPSDDTVRRWPSAGRGERHQEKPMLPMP